VITGLILTSAVIILAAGIWRTYYLPGDNLSSVSGFFSAVSTSIATIWLVTAVFVQSAELRLQRLELASQREQTRLLTQEARVQASSQSASLALQAKRDLYAQVRNIVESHDYDIRHIGNRLRKAAIDQVEPDKADQILGGTGGTVAFGRRGALVTIFKDGGSESRTHINWDAILDYFVGESDAWEAVLSCAAEAAQAHVGIWWRDNLALSVPSTGRATPADIPATLLAAIYRVEPQLMELGH
jgi:hypothetical protein